MQPGLRTGTWSQPAAVQGYCHLLATETRFGEGIMGSWKHRQVEHSLYPWSLLLQQMSIPGCLLKPVPFCRGGTPYTPLSSRHRSLIAGELLRKCVFPWHSISSETCMLCSSKSFLPPDKFISSLRMSLAH